MSSCYFVIFELLIPKKMEIFTLILLIAVLIIMLSSFSSVKHKLEELHYDVNTLKARIADMKASSPKPETREEVKVEKEEIPVLIPDRIGNLELITLPEEEPDPEPETEEEPVVQNNQVHLAEKKVVEKETIPIIKNFDFEKFIGENLMSKIGIIILVLGIGYFVKYAIDKNWIGEYGRVAIGVLIGGVLIGLAHRMRKLYKTFSSLLTGGGIGILYITIAIAFHQYHIFTQTVAFILLVLITIFSVMLSLVYDKKELAIFSQFGGFLVPFMVSTGSGNYVILFTYILILNSGILAIAWYKRWHILNILSFGATYLLFMTWLINSFYYDKTTPYLGALVFASLFYLIFFLVNVLNNLREKRALNAAEISMIFSANLFFLASGLIILNDFHDGIFRGLFVSVLGIYNFIWVLFLFRKQHIDKTLIFLLIGLVMSFISLAVPVQLHGHSITLFWTAELVILIWLWQRSQISLLKAGHLAMLALIVISVIMDWNKFYFSSADYIPVIFNKAFITGIVVLCGLGATLYFLSKEVEESFVPYVVGLNEYKILITILLTLGSYVVLHLELWYQMNHYYPDFAFRQTVYAVFNYSFLFCLILIFRKVKLKPEEIFIQIVISISLILFVAFYLIQITNTRNAYLFDNTLSANAYLFHYLVYLPIAGLIIFVLKNNSLQKEDDVPAPSIYLWLLSIFVVITLSLELDNLILVLQKPTFDSHFDILKQIHKTGYPILWGLSAFVLMLLGMKLKIRDYRIQSIGLLGIIILKLILLDVWKMSEGGRIATFIFLGILLLIISFLYQKLKRIVLEDNPELNANSHE
jgi:uncharacterized membrane protein